jgi:hypothetical protein
LLPSLWEGLGRGEAVALKTLSPTLFQMEREKGFTL